MHTMHIAGGALLRLGMFFSYCFNLGGELCPLSFSHRKKAVGMIPQFIRPTISKSFPALAGAYMALM